LEGRRSQDRRPLEGEGVTSGQGKKSQFKNTKPTMKFHEGKVSGKLCQKGSDLQEKEGFLKKRRLESENDWCLEY